VLKPGVQAVLDDVTGKEPCHRYRDVEARHPTPGHGERIDDRHTSTVVEEPLRRGEPGEGPAPRTRTRQ
jgi:hypothetical protein